MINTTLWEPKDNYYFKQTPHFFFEVELFQGKEDWLPLKKGGRSTKIQTEKNFYIPNNLYVCEFYL